MTAHTSVHSLAAAQLRDVRDAEERRRQTWTFVVVAAVLGVVAAVLLEGA